MKTFPLSLLPVLFIALLVGVSAPRLTAQEALKPAVEESRSNPATEVTTPEITGWGKASNPDSDCKFTLSEGVLSITVPGANGPHDLAAEINTINAPRVLQPVRGDFTIQVQIDGTFSPGDESTLEGRTGYNGAGLVVVLDPRNVVTLARAVLQREGEDAVPYANFEIRSDGELQRIGQTGDHRLPKDGPVFLRLERRGQKILGAVSTDGVTWDVLKAKDVPSEWPQELQVGVVAISTSKDAFTPRFTNLQILR